MAAVTLPCIFTEKPSAMDAHSAAYWRPAALASENQLPYPLSLIGQDLHLAIFSFFTVKGYTVTSPITGAGTWFRVHQLHRSCGD